MNIFKSMKLKARLISAFILMAFVAGVVGVIGYVNMREINGMANQIYNSDLPDYHHASAPQDYT